MSRWVKKRIRRDDYIDPRDLQLTNKNNRSRFILCPKLDFYSHTTADFFYEELCEESRNEINSLLCELWDTYHPKIMDTNCGRRTNGTKFHSKLIFESNDFINLLKKNKNFHHPIFNKSYAANNLSKFIADFKNVENKYINFHERNEMGYYQDDLKAYNKMENILSKNHIIYDYKKSEKYLKHFIENDIIFDLNLNFENVYQLTSVYVNIQTDENESEFKMTKSEKTINETIGKLLKTIKILQNGCKYFFNTEKWFKLYIKTAKSQNEKITIIVGAQLTLFDFIFFIHYFNLFQKHENKLKMWFEKYGSFFKNNEEEKEKENEKCEEIFANIKYKTEPKFTLYTHEIYESQRNGYKIKLNWDIENETKEEINDKNMNFYYQKNDNIWIKCEKYKLFANDKHVGLNELCLFDNVYSFKIEYIRNTSLKYKIISNTATYSYTNNNTNRKPSKLDEAIDEENDEYKKLSMISAPKKPLNSFFVFAKELRQTLQTKISMKEISKKWNKLSDDKKKPYKEQSSLLSKQYKTDKAKFQEIQEKLKKLNKKKEKQKVYQIDDAKTDKKENNKI